jgi:hypothetical protein
MSTNQFRILYNFSVVTDSLVDETTSREENGQTVSVTTKVPKKTPTYFAFKEPSRAEREDADIERASWWNKFVEKGLMPQAELMKKYSNVGTSMSDDQKSAYRQKRVDLLKLEQELKRLFVNESENEAKINEVALKLEELRDDITAFEREQSSFFENTAEAKAREKLVEYLVLHLSYFRADETKDWEPFFKGATTTEKLVSFDRMVDEQNELLGKARSQLEFLAAVRASNSGPISRDRLEEFIKEL